MGFGGEMGTFWGGFLKINPEILLSFAPKYRKIMNKLSILLVFLFSTTSQVFSQKSLLQSGPMLGYSEMREVLLWVQTKDAAEVKFTYWVKDSLNTKPAKIFQTKAVLTHEKNAFTAKLIADKVEPGNTYHYDLYINGQKIAFY